MSSARRPVAAFLLASLATVGIGAGCDGDAIVVGVESASASCEVPSYTSPSSVDRIDLVLAIDNSRSMADKQALLSVVVPDLVAGLVNPLCVDPETDDPAGFVQPKSPLAPCPAGSQREFIPVLDIHVGIVSSSLGGHGSDACPPESSTLCQSGSTTSNDDKGHLLARKDPCSTDEVPTWQGKGFLAWDPTGKKQDPPGEADAGHLGATLAEMVTGVGQLGCGYEAQLESVYRFLADPAPYESLELVGMEVQPVGLDRVLLAQRAEFLRPDSLLAVLMLSDENDCSIIDGGSYYFGAQQKNGDGSEFHLPAARAECAADPSDPCCKSCGAEPGDCPPDPTCTGLPLGKDEDNINLRCWDEKRRFGIDFLYPVERYVNMLTKPEIDPSSLNLVGPGGVPNPIFADLDPGDDVFGPRDTSLVFFGAIVGVPWQDIARDPLDLRAGLKTAVDLAAPGSDGKSAWDLILGDPEAGVPPGDPHMVESVDPRPGLSKTGDDPIHGHEWTIGKRDDLQYACIMPLPGGARDCTDPLLVSQGCDCSTAGNDNPLCDGPTQQIQARAKAYPGVRQLRVVKALGSRGIAASVCAGQLDDPSSPDYGYHSAIAAIVDRLKTSLGGRCLDHALEPDSQGRLNCVVLEARHLEDGALCDCSGPARKPFVEKELCAVDPGRWNCTCEVEQLDGVPLGRCLADVGEPILDQGTLVSGWCYVDAVRQPPLGNPDLVARCSPPLRRILRFVGQAKKAPDAVQILACGK